jgi:hypothetical protein
VHDEGTHRAAAHADSDASDNAHDAVADAAGVHDEGTHRADAHADGAHDDRDADRTLTSGTVSKHSADCDEADTSDSAISSESLDALDDASDDDSDEDELSADGHGSRELVAAPRDIDD